jgi:hypothetical protein
MTTARASVRQFLYCVVTSVLFMGWLAPARLSAQVVGATVSGTVVSAVVVILVARFLMEICTFGATAADASWTHLGISLPSRVRSP